MKAYENVNAATTAIIVTPSDTTGIDGSAYDADTSPVARAVYVGVGGDLMVTTASGSVAVFYNCPVGILPVQVRKIHSSNTTASQILGLL